MKLGGEGKSIRERIRRLIPDRDRLEGTWFHRLLGERLFAPQLWRFTRTGVAGGMALGVFIAMTPTLGIHMTAAVLLGFVLRVNIPVAVAACWVVNPLNAPIVYMLQYKLGVWMVGLPPPAEVHGYAGKVENVIRYAKPLWVGSLVTAIPAAIVSYLLILVAWKALSKFLSHGGKDDTAGSDDV